MLDFRPRFGDPPPVSCASEARVGESALGSWKSGNLGSMLKQTSHI
jgi:hypothetical protein